jgi:hypothetical protein
MDRGIPLSSNSWLDHIALWCGTRILTLNWSLTTSRHTVQCAQAYIFPLSCLSRQFLTYFYKMLWRFEFDSKHFCSTV